jgi:hypothetical protein
VRVGIGVGITDIVITFDVAGFPVAQVTLDIITTETASLLASVVDVKVGLFVPAFEPLIFHW